MGMRKRKRNKWPVKCSDTGEMCYNYSSYLQSTHWKNLRSRYYNSKLIKSCYVCGTRKNLHLHHKSYKKIGHEPLFHLIPLCSKHHLDVHKSYLAALKQKSPPKFQLWRVSKKIKKKYLKNKNRRMR